MRFHSWLGRTVAWCRGWMLLVIGTAAVLAAGGAAAQDDPPGRVGRIAAMRGEVWVYDAHEAAWVGAQVNRPLTQGDRLATGATGQAEVHLGSTTLHLGSGSEVEALRLDDERIQFTLLNGRLAMRVRSDEVAAELELLTPEGRVLPQRAGLYRVDRTDETTDAAVWRGELRLAAFDLSLLLQPGQRADFRQEGTPPATRMRRLPPLDDDFAAWVLREDRLAERGPAPVYVSPEMTGAEDLERYGSWQQHPEYGAVWAPTVVSTGWVPYRYGQWVWLRPWGWTWVDDAPWGFAPFHYGRWFWWGSRWHWAPGPRVARPVYAPALVAWYGTPQVGISIGSRVGPAVGWLPLAPREPYRPGYRASPGYVTRVNPHAPVTAPGGAPAYANRHAPGAVTVLPAPSLTSRQPVAPAALTGSDPALRRRLPVEPIHHEPPAPPRAGAPTAGQPWPQPGGTGRMRQPAMSPPSTAARLPQPGTSPATVQAAPAAQPQAPVQVPAQVSNPAPSQAPNPVQGQVQGQVANPQPPQGPAQVPGQRPPHVGAQGGLGPIPRMAPPSQGQPAVQPQGPAQQQPQPPSPRTATPGGAFHGRGPEPSLQPPAAATTRPSTAPAPAAHPAAPAVPPRPPAAQAVELPKPAPVQPPAQPPAQATRLPAAKPEVDAAARKDDRDGDARRRTPESRQNRPER